MLRVWERARVEGARPTALLAPPAPGTGDRLRLSARQLAINQRIAQAAVRRSNIAFAILESALAAADFRRGALSARELAPEPAPGLR